MTAIMTVLLTWNFMAKLIRLTWQCSNGLIGLTWQCSKGSQTTIHKCSLKEKRDLHRKLLGRFVKMSSLHSLVSLLNLNFLVRSSVSHSIQMVKIKIIFNSLRAQSVTFWVFVSPHNSSHCPLRFLVLWAVDEVAQRRAETAQNRICWSPPAQWGLGLTQATNSVPCCTVTTSRWEAHAEGFLPAHD